ncbi:hypothetical protein G6O69_27755 [Pseudenhygromyxa sp. WMMC2535]|uniref:hypothetical protein n=1 Tax=Pseudenhygromyxa sp. WMMC2535 TaxID=2712867 RepID=UPI0015577B24|nr:hypothetical protein [Pseudenhygromyxa sp. WMMC2535]NVB41665.1 hypothetical protein [Pseudenhygromyxa sp. WMMC2535]
MKVAVARQIPLLASLLVIACPLPEAPQDEDTEGAEGSEPASDSGSDSGSEGTDSTSADEDEEESGVDAGGESTEGGADTGETGETGDTSGESEGEPGACLGEVDDPQADEFVGDGYVDTGLALTIVAAQPPVELELGARIHMQGTSFDCCDDDVAIDESVVVRSYPQERFLLAQVSSWETLPPSTASAFLGSFFVDMDIDPETWLRPFELSAHDDMICDSYYHENADAVRDRMHVYVDGGECETAKIMDENAGYFADVFFVRIGDVHTWTPSGETGDTNSQAEVFIARQSCEQGACPETTQDAECPADDQWPEDRAVVDFAYGFEPSGVGYDLICEILEITDEGDSVYYGLDCGEHCVEEDAAASQVQASQSADQPQARALPACI